MDSWPGTMQEEVKDQMDTAEACKMMNGMYENEGGKELNLEGVNIKTTEI